MAMVKERARALGAAAIFAGALALALPATSGAAHDLRVYKVEKQVVLDSDADNDVNVACLGTDRVLDGMWRIDHADLDEDQPAFGETIGQAVDVREAWSDTPHRYHFSFVKHAIYRVQLKVFATCLGGQTEAGGSGNHAHEMTYTPAAGAPHTDAAQIPANSVGLKSATATCATDAKRLIIAPGFRVLATEDANPADPIEPPIGIGRMFRSNLTDTSPTSLANSWTWSFALGSLGPPNHGGGAVEVSWRCLNVRVDKLPGGGAAPDRHKLVKKVRSASAPVNAGAFAQHDLNCGDHYKAMVAGFSILPGSVSGALASFGAWKTWYLGMDPRPKSRSYRFMSTGPGDTVTLAATCLNYRTT